LKTVTFLQFPSLFLLQVNWKYQFNKENKDVFIRVGLKGIFKSSIGGLLEITIVPLGIMILITSLLHYQLQGVFLNLVNLE